MAAEAGVVERGGVPAVPDIQVYFLLLRQVAGGGGEAEAGSDRGRSRVGVGGKGLTMMKKIFIQYYSVRREFFILLYVIKYFY